MASYQESVEELEKCTLEELHKFTIKDEVHLAKVLACYDGDTLTCAFKYSSKYHLFKVRLLLYDSEEIRQSTKLTEEERQKRKALALSAKARLEELVLNKNVILECYGFDAFGRILGIVKLDGLEKSINQIMLDEGHGEYVAPDL